MTSFGAPRNRMQIGGIVLSPKVKRVLRPAIKMYFDLSVHHVTDGGHSDKDWIPPVNRFDFHTFSELRRIVFGIFESPLGHGFTSSFF